MHMLGRAMLPTLLLEMGAATAAECRWEGWVLGTTVAIGAGAGVAPRLQLSKHMLAALLYSACLPMCGVPGSTSLAVKTLGLE